MVAFKVSMILPIVLCSSALAWGGRQGQNEGYGGGQNAMARGHQNNQGYEGENYGNPMSRGGGRQFGGDDSRKYRSNLYNDEDVYGYDASYPNGEASYINYKSKDARGRRGPEFKKLSRAYSHGQEGGGQGGYGNGYGRSNGQMGGHARSGGSHGQNYGGQY